MVCVHLSVVICICLRNKYISIIRIHKHILLNTNAQKAIELFINECCFTPNKSINYHFILKEVIKINLT